MPTKKLKKNSFAPITLAQARHVVEVVDAGLVADTEGEPVPGEMCVESAVAYALGYPHNDQPKCVANCVRDFKITVNDGAPFKDEKDRAKGLRRIAVAQLGSAGLVRGSRFQARLNTQLISTLLPRVFRGIDIDANVDFSPFLTSIIINRYEVISALTRVLKEMNSKSLEENELAIAIIDRNHYSDILDCINDTNTGREYTDDLIKCAIEVLRSFNVPGVKLMDRLIKEGIL
jgi:hypothetical protein